MAGSARHARRHIHVGGVDVLARPAWPSSAVALAVGVGLWLWLKKTRTGMVIRAGVDDRQMVSALGVNIQLTFAIAFFVGSALAGFGGAIGGSFASLGPGVDANWLLYSLVVVIIGGMGSLVGRGRRLAALGLVSTFSAVYLPANYTTTRSSFTFGLLALVLAFRPQGLFGQARMSVRIVDRSPDGRAHGRRRSRSSWPLSGRRSSAPTGSASS